MNYQPIVGMEIHVELKTNSKMFCGCPADHFGKKPNTQTCPVCLGLPGALPVPNKKAVEWTIKLGLALGCDIATVSKFDRKHYFYPDLAKGYQISQYDEPLCTGGNLDDVRIRRVHLEEDTGKLIHASVDGKRVSLVDFNRSGVPLVEIVTEPDIHSSEQAKIFLKKLHQIVRYLDISDADMEKGSMRLEPNISLRTQNTEPASLAGRPNDQNKTLPNYKVEVKNINSFRFVGKAIDFEIARHSKILDKGNTPPQETRGWDESKNATVSQRSKEDAMDYRYFPEPDIPPMRFTKLQISEFRTQIPELPAAKKNRFLKDFHLPPQDVDILTDTRDFADYFEEAIRVGKDHDLTPKHIANFLINKKVDREQILPATLIKQIMEAKQVVHMDEAALDVIVHSIIESNPKAVADYRAGKTTVIMFLVGAVMREAKGIAQADTVKKKLENLL
jgi:aspartyl-tRNA(Asn)/glutamyl-tRNA(Gln) amidotransferase subunit B